MSENIYRSKYKGKEIDSAVEKVLSNKFATQESLEQINTNKLDKGAKTSVLINDGDGNSNFITEKKTSELLKEINSNLTNKVDKEDNKGLSSNDFTDDEKAKLESLPNSTEFNKGIKYIEAEPSNEDLWKPNVDDVQDVGLYHVQHDSGSEYVTSILLVEGFDIIYQTLITSGGSIYNRHIYLYDPESPNYNNWSEWEEKSSVSKSYVDSKISDINSAIEGKQGTSNSLVMAEEDTDVLIIHLDGKAMYYDASSGIGTDYLINIYADALTLNEHTFYVFSNISDTNGGIPTLEVKLYKNNTQCQLTWLDESTIEKVHTKNLFAFQTTDGGNTWVANQCYSLEV